jgi:ankyrin repeat protein
MGGLCDKNEKSLIENFELYSDNEFIEYIQKNVLTDNNDNDKTSRNNSKNKFHEYNKLNEPINYFDDTILHYAVYQKRKKLIQFLIYNGADPRMENIRGVTPKEIAKRNGLENYLETIK